MLTLEGLMTVIGLCMSSFSLGYMLGSKNKAKK